MTTDNIITTAPGNANAPEERIGKYRVHPVASLFPPLPDDEYEDLKGSIELIGQTYPIIVQDDWLLDGRNRLRACLELEILPKIQEYRGNEQPEFFIETVNMHRRHLDEDARAAISAKIREWVISRQNAEAQKTGKSADGLAGGRGRKKNLEMESSPGLAEPKTRAKDARSTVGQIAEAAQVSHHKAAQAVAVAKADSELLDQVVKGNKKLKDAHAQVKAKKAAAPKRPSKPDEYEDEYYHARSRLVGTIHDAINKYPERRDDLRLQIISALDRESGHQAAALVFIEDVQSGITRQRLMGGLLGKMTKRPVLVNILDWVQYKLAFIADLQAEITRRRKEAEAASERDALDKQLRSIIDWVYDELERFQRAGKPKAAKQ
jgi:hypothetical protein